MKCDHKRGSGCIVLKDNIVATIDRSDRIKETKDSEKYCRGSSLSFNCGGIGAKVRIFFFLLFILFFILSLQLTDLPSLPQKPYFSFWAVRTHFIPSFLFLRKPAFITINDIFAFDCKL